MRVALSDYVDAAVTVLGLDLDGETFARKWVLSRWQNIAELKYNGRPSAKDTVERLLAGTTDVTQNALGILHDVLGLRDYGLGIEETWKAAHEDQLRYSPDGFAALLRSVREQHREPVHLLRRQAEAASDHDRLLLELARDVTLGEPLEPAPRAASGAIRVTAKSKISLFAVPRTTGHVVLLSHRLQDGAVTILNETLGVSRDVIHPANRLIAFPAPDIDAPTWPEFPGPREIFAVNMQGGERPRRLELEPFFASRERDPDERDIRRLGGALFELAEDPERARGWVGRMVVDIR